MILWIRTDQPDAVIVLTDNASVFGEHTWYAHRELSTTILTEISKIITGKKLNLDDLTQICVYEGPGSFTGLRIGITVANTLSFALSIPVYAVGESQWKDKKTIIQNPTRFASPLYGAEATITKQKK